MLKPIMLVLLLTDVESKFDKLHSSVLQNKHGLTCGVSNESSSKRVINSETVSAKIYPWLAMVYRLSITKDALWHPEKYLNDDPDGYILGQCGGSIISPKIILTAGHCICDGFIYRDDLSEERAETCILDVAGKPEKNQNQKRINEIYYTLGTKSMSPQFEQMLEMPQFKDNIEAYLYKYTSSSHFNRAVYGGVYPHPNRYGDFGVVMDINGFSMTKHGAVPVCLPTNKMFLELNENKNDETPLKVTLAGRGKRFQIRDGNANTTCFTNEARAIDHNLAINDRHIFLSCKPLTANAMDLTHLPNDDDYCVKKDSQQVYLKDDFNGFIKYKSVKSMMAENKFHSFSSRSEILFEYKNPDDTATIRVIIDPPKNDQCEIIWEKAKEAYKQHYKQLTNNIDDLVKEYEERVDRVVVLKEKISDAQICYNYARVARHGFCQTDQEPFYMWGFCSPSCVQTQDLEYSENHLNSGSSYLNYQKYDGEYFEIIPKDEQDRKRSPKCSNDIKCRDGFECVGSLLIKDCLSEVYKCIQPTIPKADNAVFTEESLKGKLEWETWYQDDEIVEMEHGYQKTASGDSGSGYFVFQDDEEGHLRATIVAVHSSTKDIFEAHTKTTKCRGKATKLTDEMIAWIKEKDPIHMYRSI